MLLVSLLAILAPFDQSAVEIRHILSDPAFVHIAPSAEAIELIEKTAGGWVIATKETTILAAVTYIPRWTPGPQVFNVTYEKQ